jgi:lysophospholipase L1-like esterase
MKRLITLLAALMFSVPAWGAFTDNLAVDAKYAFIGDSWTSNSERPRIVGGTNYPSWSDSGYFSQSAEWAYRVCQNMGVRDYRVFATSGAQVRYDGTGIAQYIPDVLTYKPDYAFIYGGINDCADAPATEDQEADSIAALVIAGVVIDSLQSMIDQLHSIDTRVSITWLHPTSSYSNYKADIDDTLKWTMSKEIARNAINAWILSLTESNNLAIHTDFWLEDTGGTFDGTDVDSTVIDPTYNKDNIHLNHLGNFTRGDSLWVNTLGSTTFTDSPVTFYVDWDTGHDWSNSGRTLASPYKTLQQALFRVRPGDRVEVLTDSVDNYFWHENETFAEIINHGYSNAPITLDFNGNLFSDPYDATSRKVFYHVLQDSTYYTTDSTDINYVIEDAIFFPQTSGAIYELGWGGLTVKNCTFYDESVQLNNSSDNLIEDSFFYGFGVDIDADGNYVKIVDSYFERNATWNAGEQLRVSGCDSLVVIGSEFVASVGPTLYMFYQQDSTPGDATDVYRFINSEFTASADVACMWVDANLTGTMEIKNCVISNAAGYAAKVRDTFTYDVDNNFLLGNLYNSGNVSIATWRTATGGANQWDYSPTAVCDTLKYGGARHAVYGADVGIPHSHDWCSIGATQYNAPTIPERFATPTDSDSLVDLIPWQWTAADTIRMTEWNGVILPHKLKLQMDMGVPAHWGGGWN